MASKRSVQTREKVAVPEGTVAARGVDVHGIWAVESAYVDLGFTKAIKPDGLSQSEVGGPSGFAIVPDVRVLLSRNGERDEALVWLRIKVAPNAQPTFEVSVSYVGLYSVGEDPVVPLEKFAWTNGIANLVPYVRAHLAHLTAGGAYPAYMLPPLSVKGLLELAQVAPKGKRRSSKAR